MSSNHFAILTPENAAAQKCLALLVDRDGDRQSLPNLVTAAQTDLEPAKSTDRAARSKYQFVLSLDQDGSGSGGSWKIGKGSTKHISSVDIPLCSPKSRYFKGPVLGVISIEPQSGAIVIRNISEHQTIVYVQGNGNTDVELRFGDKHVLHMTANHLRFGPLDYLLEFSVESEARFSDARAEYIRKHAYLTGDMGPPLYSHLDALPKPTHVRIGDVVLHRTVAQGTFGVVRVGVHRPSGEVIACKTIHCRKRDITAVQNEISINSGLPSGAVGIVPVQYAWCEHGHSPPCFSTALEDVHIGMPYALYDFATAPWPEIPMGTRLGLFYQVLHGLRGLHAVGIMHRDISPRNLLIFSLHESAPRAGICDFGKAKKAARGTTTSLGPPGYTAPEVWRREGHTNAIDIFSLGLSMLHTFQTPQEAGPIDEKVYEEILQLLARLREQGHIPENLGALLHAMLAWDPADRPTAEQALEDEAWEGLRTVGEVFPGRSSDGSSGSSTSSGSAREKRMRRSDGPSPDSPARASERDESRERDEPSGRDE